MDKPGDTQRDAAFPPLGSSLYSRRQALGLLGAGSAALLAGSALGPVPARGAAAPAGPPKKGGVLRIGQQFDINPTRVYSITYQHYSIIYSIFDTLIRLDARNKPQPELAESWRVSPDQKQLTLKLRRGVRFHSGRPLTAEDILWNLRRVADPKAGSQHLTMARSFTKLEAPDAGTVVITFDAPKPAIFDMLDALWIFDPQAVADLDSGKRWVGSGPFMWQDWKPGDQLSLKRFDGYWKPGLPHLDGITMTVVGDPQSLAAQLQGNALDLIVNPPFEQVPGMRQDRGLFVLESETGAQMYYVGLNVSTAPLDKKEVRHAINYAIDRQRVVQVAMNGIGEATAIPWPRSSFAYDAQKQKAFAFNLDKSKELLAKVGLSGGFDLPFVTSQALPGMARMAQIIQSDLAKVNIRAKIEEIESAEQSNRLINRKYTHAWTLSFGFNNLHPSTMPTVAYPWRVGLNSSYYEHPEYKELVEKLRVTTDEAQAKQTADKLTDHILDAAFVLPVTPQKRMWAMRAAVKNALYSQEDALFLENAWIDR